MNLRTDTARDLGNPCPDDSKEKPVALFDCQECGNRFPATFNGDRIVAITCSCGADYTYLTKESTTEELLGL